MNEPEITKDTFPKFSPNPITINLPAYLKDPANYKKVMKTILDAGATRHSHGELIEWTACKKCQRKLWDRKEMMKALGFQNGAQYLTWKKQHEYIIQHPEIYAEQRTSN